MFRKIFLMFCMIGLMGTNPASATTEITIPFPPGGPVDLFGRSVQQYLTERLNLQAVTVNRPGAEGRIAVRHALSQPPDGKNILIITTGAFMFNRLLHPNLEYNVHDFDVITPVATIPYFIIVSESSNIKNLNDFVDQSRKRPVICAVATAATRFLGTAMKTSLGLTGLDFVSYKSVGEMIRDVTGNNLECSIDAAAAQYLPNRSRVVATSDDDPAFKVPMIKDAVPGLTSRAWFGIAVLKNTPEPIKQQIFAAMREIHKDPKFRSTMNAANIQVRPLPALNNNDFIEREYQYWKRMLDRNPRMLDY